MEYCQIVICHFIVVTIPSENLVIDLIMPCTLWGERTRRQFRELWLAYLTSSA